MYSIELEPNNPELLVLLTKYYYLLDSLEHLEKDIKDYSKTIGNDYLVLVSDDKGNKASYRLGGGHGHGG